jgi:mono/diheme cytochrome c family protein
MKSFFKLQRKCASLTRPAVGARLIRTSAFALLAILLAGCRLDMHDQPKFKPLRENDFYSDLRSSRPIIGGTVARGQLNEDTYLHTGFMNGKEGDVMPFPATREVLERGRERYNIYCSPCHSQLGDGNGMVVQRGFKRPPSYHIDRLRKAPIGHFYNVMTNGYGAMADYASQVPVNDRWAIAAYIRALQLSQNATPSDVPPGATIASQPPQVNAIWPPPTENTKAMHGEGAGLREGKNE